MLNHFRAHRLKAFRKSYRLTQGELGEMVGLSADQIARIESGRRRPSIEALLKIKLIFGKPDEDIIPETFMKAVDHVWFMAQKLRSAILFNTDRRSKRKVELFDAILSRLALFAHQQ